MLNKTLIIESVSRELGLLKDLVEELQSRPRFTGEDWDYCDRSLRRVESDLKKIRTQSFNHGKYSGLAIYRMVTQIR
jgi:hypothetical protein